MIQQRQSADEDESDQEEEQEEDEDDSTPRAGDVRLFNQQERQSPITNFQLLSEKKDEDVHLSDYGL